MTLSKEGLRAPLPSARATFAEPQPQPDPESAAPAEAPRRGGGRLRALDGLRLIAALMVCLYHFSAKDGPTARSWGQSPGTLFPTLSGFGTYGYLGVQVFFVISGFVICMSGWGKTLGHFFRSRVSRLYPAYWVALVIITAAAIALPVVVRPLRPDEFLLNFTMLQQPMGAHRVLGVCWTLWVELKFYLLFGLFVIWKGATYRRVVLFCCLWTVAGVFARVADTPLTDELVMRDHAPFFIGGLALYLIHRYGGDLLLWGIVGFSFLMGQRYAVSAGWHSGAEGPFARNPYVIQAVVAFAFLSVAVVALGWLRWANWRWLTVAGALTYPFYLIHEHLGWFVIRVLHRGLDVPPVATFALTILALLVLAWLIHHLVEKPFGPWLNRTMATQAGRLRELKG